MKVHNKSYKTVNLEETLFKGNKEQVKQTEDIFFFCFHFFIYTFDKMTLIYVCLIFIFLLEIIFLASSHCFVNPLIVPISGIL